MNRQHSSSPSERSRSETVQVFLLCCPLRQHIDSRTWGGGNTGDLQVWKTSGSRLECWQCVAGSSPCSGAEARLSDCRGFLQLKGRLRASERIGWGAGGSGCLRPPALYVKKTNFGSFKSPCSCSEALSCCNTPSSTVRN